MSLRRIIRDHVWTDEEIHVLLSLPTTERIIRASRREEEHADKKIRGLLIVTEEWVGG